VVKNHGVVAAEIPAHRLREEGPVYQRPIAAPAPRVESEKDWFQFTPEGMQLTENFKKYWLRRRSLLSGGLPSSTTHGADKYFGGAGRERCAVVRIKESEKDGPNGKTMRALALSTDGNGRWCQLNPKMGAMHAWRSRRGTLRRAERVRLRRRIA